MSTPTETPNATAPEATEPESQTVPNIDVVGKVNKDGSYSVSLSAEYLAAASFVDYYNEYTGTGFQRFETGTGRRGSAIADYIKRSKDADVPPHMFDLTANLRIDPEDVTVDNPKGLGGNVAVLHMPELDGPAISIIDGGTRTVGIRKAMERGTVDPKDQFDVRLYIGLSEAEEAVIFELINGQQKLVRSDLSTRLIERLVDEGNLDEKQLAFLQTVIPQTQLEGWKFLASGLAARLAKDEDSIWNGRVQMPGAVYTEAGWQVDATKPIKLASMAASLKPLLTSDTLKMAFGGPEGKFDSKRFAETIYRAVNNLWHAVAEANPNAYEYPTSSALFGGIGVTSLHIALAEVLEWMVTNEEKVDFKQGRLLDVITEGGQDSAPVADYALWFKGVSDTSSAAAFRKRHGMPEAMDLPATKGSATRMTGGSNMTELGKKLSDGMLDYLESEAQADEALSAPGAQRRAS